MIPRGVADRLLAFSVDNLDDDVSATRRLDQLDYMDYVLSERREQLRSMLRGKYHEFRSVMQEAEEGYTEEEGSAYSEEEYVEQQRQQAAQEPAPVAQTFEDLLASRPQNPMQQQQPPLQQQGWAQQMAADAAGAESRGAAQLQQQLMAKSQAVQMEQVRQADLLEQKRRLEEALQQRGQVDYDESTDAGDSDFDTDDEMYAAEMAAQSGTSTADERQMLMMLQALAQEKERLQLELQQKLSGK